ISIGAGGAIVYLCDPELEWQEVLLKSQTVLPSVLEYLNANMGEI
ncbi:4639_t:CDS:2, partial [Acaulospora morrowiae]